MPYIFRSWITVKGHRIYARQHGIKAFPIWIDESDADEEGEG